MRMRGRLARVAIYGKGAAMQKRVKWLTGALAVLAIAGFAFAGKTAPTGTVVGQNGWTATEVFRVTDIPDDLPEWGGIPDLGMRVHSERLAENSAGELYVMLRGWRTSPEEFLSGVVHYDPATATFTGISQESAVYVTASGTTTVAAEGSVVFAVATVPADGGGLTKDDVLVLRLVFDEQSWDGTSWVGDEWVEVVRYPADASEDGGVDVAAEEVLFTYSGGHSYGALAADGAGNVYVICVDMLKTGVSLNNTIRKLTYDSGAGTWSDSELLSGAGDLWHQLRAFDGSSLFTVVAGATSSDDSRVIEIDPSTGSWSSFSTLPAGRSVNTPQALAADGGGVLRIGFQSSPAYVTEAPEGGSATGSDRIAEYYLQGALATRAAGGLWVSSGVYSVTSQGGGSYYFELLYDAVFTLTPPAAGGGGGGGGGHGGGPNK